MLPFLFLFLLGCIFSPQEAGIEKNNTATIPVVINEKNESEMKMEEEKWEDIKIPLFASSFSWFHGLVKPFLVSYFGNAKLINVSETTSSIIFVYKIKEAKEAGKDFLNNVTAYFVKARFSPSRFATTTYDHLTMQFSGIYGGRKYSFRLSYYPGKGEIVFEVREG